VSAPGFWEWVALAILALLIFGPERLPKIARSAGQMIAKFKAEATSTLDELKTAADLEEVSGVARELRETTQDLKRSVDLTGPVASGAPPAAQAATPTATAVLPPPFDPDTP
jgi:sec-independent protein translocase protein TatB